MTDESGRSFLRNLLVTGYEDFRRRLTRHFGSADVAGEVLQETYLRLTEAGDIGTLHQPQFYLYRMALNVAADRRRAETRWVEKAEIEALRHTDDDLLDPERIAAARSEIAELKRVLSELPPQRRAICMAALIEEQSYRAIAARFGVSLRTVEREMRRALDHCGKRLGRKLPKRAGRAPRETS